VNRSSHDYSGAEDFGDLIFMTDGSLRRFSVSRMCRLFEPFIRRSEPYDYILLSGMTVMCSVACAMFAAKHGRLNLLIYKPDPRSPSTYVERVSIFKETKGGTRYKESKDATSKSSTGFSKRSRGELYDL